MAGKVRLDVLVVERRLADSREKAKAYIMAGNVFVNGVREDKAGTMVKEDCEIELKGIASKYVSRGGFKLEKAVELWHVPLEGRVCMDVGSSTGGFTDCMLQNGATRVYAIDSGTNQLAWKLRSDPRVVSMEQTNIRYVTAVQIPEKVQTVSIDVSFISLTKVLSPVRALCEEGASIVTLIKPQFEAGREKVGKKGVVRESSTHIEVITKVITYALAHGFEFKNLSFSPIKGPEGNIEYLALFETAKGYEASEDDGTAPETGADEICNIDISDEGSEMSVRDEELSVAPEIAKLIADTVEQAHAEL
ncbi:MAG: TlyA family RNA methyltransferase [Lachnospiraceae bacterium]|nr:TlyA family RNA methyltransferase [Lachnospiraceae bacterium]